MSQVGCVILAHFVGVWGCERGASVQGGTEAEVWAPGASDVVGAWCGSPTRDERCDGDEALYVELRAGEEEGALEGAVCEAPGQDCFDLDAASWEGDELRFTYHFEEPVGGAPTEVEVRATLTLDPRADTLRGALWSSKCACSVERLLWRMPSVATDR